MVRSSVLKEVGQHADSELHLLTENHRKNHKSDLIWEESCSFLSREETSGAAGADIIEHLGRARRVFSQVHWALLIGPWGVESRENLRPRHSHSSETPVAQTPCIYVAKSSGGRLMPRFLHFRTFTLVLEDLNPHEFKYACWNSCGVSISGYKAVRLAARLPPTAARGKDCL